MVYRTAPVSMTWNNH